MVWVERMGGGPRVPRFHPEDASEAKEMKEGFSQQIYSEDPKL